MMTSKKFVFYLDNVDRAVVISEKNEESVDDISKRIGDLISKFSVCEFGNEKDRLVVRSNRIVAVHIQQGGALGRPKSKASALERKEILSQDKDEDNKKIEIESMNLLYTDLDLGELEEKTGDSENEVEFDEDTSLITDDESEILQEVEGWHEEVDAKDIEEK